MSSEYQKYSDMTVLSRQKYDLARSSLSLAEACRELRENAYVRSVREILAKAAGLSPDNTDALSRILKSGLAELTPALPADSIRRKVSNWLAPDTHLISKSSAIQMAFLFSTDIAAAESLIMLLCGERLHWRNPEEIVYGFALNNGRSYQEACSIYADLSSKGIFSFLDNDSEIMTENLEYDLLHIHSTDELETYRREHKKQLGTFHNTARQTVSEFLAFLKRPIDADYLPLGRGRSDAQSVSEDTSVQQIVLDNLYGSIIPHTRRASKAKHSEKLLLDSLQKSIREGWPEETVLSKIENGRLDVSRKTLILLFLASDGADSIYSDWYEDTREDVFEDRLTRLNTMLTDCGFSLIDPRLPFDWIVLYCLCDEESFVDDKKMQKFLTEIYSTSSAE